MFGIFLFVTYYMQVTLGFSPIQTGLAFLPMIGMLVLAAQLGTNLLVPRFGPKIMVPTGMALGVVAMVLLTRLDENSSYAPHILIPLMIMGTAMGTIMPASMQTATLGVDREFAGVASAMVNTSSRSVARSAPRCSTRLRRPPRPTFSPRTLPSRGRSQCRQPSTATRPRTGGAQDSSPSVDCLPRFCSVGAATVSRSRMRLRHPLTQSRCSLTERR